MDYELLQRAIAKQNGQPYGAGLGGGQPLQVDPMALTTSPDIAPVQQQQVAQAVAPPTEQLFAQRERFMAGAQAPVVEPQAAQPVASDPVHAIDSLAGSQADAAMRIGEQEEQSYKRVADAGAQYMREADEIAANHMDRHEAADAMYQKTMGEYRALNDAVAKLPPITAKTPGVWGAISLIGAGFSEGLAPGNNAVAQQQAAIDTRIQRDIELQQKNYDAARNKAQAKFSEVGLARQYIGDNREATQFALGMRKERFGAAMEVEAAKLKSATARDRALQAAAQYRIEGKKEQLDVLKSLLAGRMSAVDVAMLKKMGMLPEGIGGYGAGQAAQGAAPAGKVIGNMTKAQEGQVNIAGHQASAGPWRAKDPSKADPVQTRKVQDYYAQNRIYTNALSELENLYREASDANIPEEQRRLAMTQFGIKRDEAIAKLSQKDEQGVVTNPEFARKIESLKAPPANLLEQGYRVAQEAWSKTISGPQVFQAMRSSADRELDVMMESRDWTREAAPAAAAHEAKRKAPAAGGAKPAAGKPKRSAVATSPEDFD